MIGTNFIKHHYRKNMEDITAAGYMQADFEIKNLG